MNYLKYKTKLHKIIKQKIPKNASREWKDVTANLSDIKKKMEKFYVNNCKNVNEIDKSVKITCQNWHELENLNSLLSIKK